MQYTLFTKTKVYFNSSKIITNPTDYYFRFKNSFEIRNIKIIRKIFGKQVKACEHFNAKNNLLKGIKFYE